MTIVTPIPGADELVGQGVYRGMPKEVPQPVRDRQAVVVGGHADCTPFARQLVEAGWKVTVVTGGSGGGLSGEWRRKVGTEVVCASGIEYLEALVLRRIDTGRIEACNASALFIL